MAQVLLVDDERLARTLYSDFLAGAGHDVVAVASMEEAQSILRTTPVELVVTDLLLPAGDGLELLQHVKSLYPAVEVVVITSLDKVEPAVRAIKSGASDFLLKPVPPDVLARAVESALTQHSLLRENADLRRYVAMLEAGQRIATTLDRERLFDTACVSFETLSRAHAVLLLQQQGSELVVVHAHQVPEPAAPAVREAVQDAVRALHDANLPQELPAAALPAAYGSGFYVPAREGNLTLGAAVLLFERARVAERDTASATYLGRHLALGLKNQGRFAQMSDLVYLDDLTHLFNSRYLTAVLDKAVKVALGSSEVRPFSVLFLDLDSFKTVNDTHGHLMGSRLLVEVARVLKGCVRDNDVVCRWGGDEYVLLLRNTDAGGALRVAERIRGAIEGHTFLQRETLSVRITTCVGVASFPEHARSQEQLVDLADRAMYRGKKGTRNVVYLAALDLEATPAARHQADARFTPPLGVSAEPAAAPAPRASRP